MWKLQKQITDTDAKIQKLEQLLAAAPRSTSSHSAKDAFRLEQEQDRLARAPRLELEKTQEARKAARAALCDATGPKMKVTRRVLAVTELVVRAGVIDRAGRG